MTTRVITRQQFSADTTIDGNRIELSLQDIQDRYNNPEFRDIDMWSENKYHYGFTPLNIFSERNLAPYKQGSPFAYAIESTMFPSVPNYEGPNNEYRLKGAALVDPDTGIPSFSTSADTIPRDLSFFWTATQYFTKPSIIQDWTIFGLYDDKFGVAPTYLNKWYGNEWATWVEGHEPDWTNKYVCWIVIDNPQDTGNTFIRNSEIHSWACSSEGLTMGLNQRIYNGTIGYSDETLQYNPTLAGPTEQKINGNAIRFHNLNIPIYAGSRVRFIFALPCNIQYNSGLFQYPGQAVDTPYYPDIGLQTGNNWFGNPRITTYQNNLWNMSIHCLEPLEKIRNV